jgi:hypothetical protein
MTLETVSPFRSSRRCYLTRVPAAADGDDDRRRWPWAITAGRPASRRRAAITTGRWHYRYGGHGGHGGHGHRHHDGCGHRGWHGPRVVKNHYYGYPVHHYGYAPAAYCGPCGNHFDSYDDLSYHVHHHHHIAALQLPFVIFQASVGGGAGWVFGH